MADVRETELVLPPGVHAFVLDNTKGHINTLCGPIKQSLSNTDQLVTFDPAVRRFVPASNAATAIRTNVLAAKGQYVVLGNPASKHPEPGKAEVMSGGLRYGETDVIPGPVSFPLWPGQTADVVDGHHLRSNQYLIVRVDDDAAARKNWNEAIVKVSDTPETVATPTDDKPKKGRAASAEEPAPVEQGFGSINVDRLYTGQTIIIKGTEVSFYIPPTGVTVLVDESGEYVRSAITLERLEYCLLLDENGNKQYRHGPDVVFPKPTEQFVTGKDGKRKFRAYELNDITGIHVKVIADYSETLPNSLERKSFRAGDELFITGKEMAIYYPRPEHAIIRYGDQEKYHAIAIPAGEARYVLDRHSGVVKLVRGPAMYLPNPIDEVIVRRVLSDRESELYFPNNTEVLAYNRALRGVAETGASYALSDKAATLRGFSASYGDSLDMTLASATRSSNREMAGKGTFGDELNRSTSFTPPRTLTLNTKFEGAIQVDVWSGHAVQVVNKNGSRRIVVGPQTVVLEYDEFLERMALSTGKPKNTDRLFSTVFLRVASNAVTDIITVKTSDMVTVELKIKYLVRFEEELKDRWFNVDNYVKYFTDHLRSVIGNFARGVGVQQFYREAAMLVRGLVLGEKSESGQRPLKSFPENGMTLYELEVLTVEIKDANIRDMLQNGMTETLRFAVEADKSARNLELVKSQQSTLRATILEKEETERVARKIALTNLEHSRKVSLEEIEERRELNDRKLAIEAETVQAKAEMAAVERAATLADSEVTKKVAEEDLERYLKKLAAESQATVAQAQSVSPELVSALTALADAGKLEQVARHLAPLSLVRNQSLSATLEQLLAGTPLSGVLKNIGDIGVQKSGLQG